MGIFEGNFEPTASGVNPLPKPKVCQDAAKRAELPCETCRNNHHCELCNIKPKQPTSGNNMYYGWIIMPDDEFNGRASEIVKECEIFLKQKKIRMIAKSLKPE